MQKKYEQEEAAERYDLLPLIRISQCKKVIRRRKRWENFKTEVG